MTNSRDDARRQALTADFPSERRRFLLKLIGLGAAGLAVGGGGAWAKTEWDAATNTAASLGDLGGWGSHRLAHRNEAGDLHRKTRISSGC